MAKKKGGYKAKATQNASTSSPKMDIDTPPPGDGQASSSTQPPNGQPKTTTTTTPNDDVAMTDADSAENVKEQGNAAFKAKQYSKAIDLYSQAIHLDAANTAYLSNRAAAYMALRRYNEALSDMQLATATPPPTTKSLLRLSKCYIALAQMYQARSTLDQLLKLDPANVEASREMSRVDRMTSNLQSVQSARNRKDHSMTLIGLDGLERECETGLTKEWKGWKVEAYCGKKKWNEASSLASDLVRSNQADPEALYFRGLVMYHQGNLTAAIKHCQEALRCDPDFVKARTLLRQSRLLESLKEEGNASFKRGDHQEAISKYNEAINVDVDNISLKLTLLSNTATAYSKLGQHEKAIEVCDQVLEVEKQHFKALRTRGKSKLVLEDFEGAVRDLEAAHEAAPSGSGDASALKRDVKEAKVELKKSKQKDYYKILGVERDAGDVDIKKAFRRQSLIHHPDKGGDEAKFKEINAAYAILSDPKKRQMVDQGVDPDDPTSGGMGGGHPFDMGGGIPVNLADLFGGGGGSFTFTSGGGGGAFPGGAFGGGFPGGGGGGFNPFGEMPQGARRR